MTLRDIQIRRFEILVEILKTRLQSAKKRSKKKGVECNLTLEDLVRKFFQQNGRCYFSNEPLILYSNHRNTISLDRLNNDLWYTNENVVLVTRFINNAKSSCNEESFIDIIVNLQGVFKDKKSNTVCKPYV